MSQASTGRAIWTQFSGKDCGVRKFNSLRLALRTLSLRYIPFSSSLHSFPIHSPFRYNLDTIAQHILEAQRLKKYVPILNIAALYVIFAAIWILFSDRILAWFIGDAAQYVWAQTLKGWFFVLVTALLLYNTILHEFKRHWNYEREMERVAAFSKDIRGILDPHILTLKILAHLRSLFQAEMVFFGQTDSTSKTFRLSFLQRDDELISHYLPFNDPFWQPVLEKAITLSSLSPSPAKIDDGMFPTPIRYYVITPLIAREIAIGLIGFAKSTPIQSSDIPLLQAMADIASQAFFAADLLDNNFTQIRRLSSLRKIDDTILSDFDVKNLIHIILQEYIQNLNIDAASITVINTDLHIVDIYSQAGMQEADPLYQNEAYEYAQSCDSILVIQNTKAGIHSERTYPLHHPIRDRQLIGYAVAPLVTQQKQIGVVEVFSHDEITWNREYVQFFEALTRQTAIAIDKVNLVLNLQKSNIELIKSYEETLEGWSRALDMRDHETENHTQRVTALTTKMGEKLGLSAEQLTHMRRGALLHDIGKLAVPDQILLKEGDLSSEEWEIMRRHPVTARSLIEPISFLAPAIVIPYFHHEKWDGSGYPQGLEGGEIPIEARIFAIVDVWDALTNDRPYRKALSPQAASEYLLSQSGHHFDPQIVTAFLKLMVEEGILSDADLV